MPDNPLNLPGAAPPTCPACGRRPATIRLVLNTEAGRTAGTVCESCARALMHGMPAGGPAGPPGFGPAAGASGTPGDGAPQSATPALDGFGRDLTADARAGRIDPVIGREREIEQTVEILARRRKNNAVLI